MQPIHPGYLGWPVLHECSLEINEMAMKNIFVIHENEEWMPPLKNAFDSLGLVFEELHMGKRFVDLDSIPRQGVYYNRMSASSWTRQHEFAPQLTLGLLETLSRSDCRIVNGSKALDLEISKARQFAELKRVGLNVPKSYLCIQKSDIVQAARGLSGAIILKPDSGGKGAGVRLFSNLSELEHYCASEEFQLEPEMPIIIQEYIEPAEPFIIRNEFVGGEHLYSVRVDTSKGFELCPADACAIEGDVCPAGEQTGDKFEILKNFTHPNILDYRKLMKNNDVEIAGIEMILDRQGKAWTYDININTNYNVEAEAAAEFSQTGQAGMFAVAEYLGLLSEQLPSRQQAVG